MERLVKFEVLGQEYPLRTDAPDDELQEILDLVKTQLESCSKSSTVLPAKSAVLVSLNMAGKYVRLKREFDNHKKVNSEKFTSLIEKIESVL